METPAPSPLHVPDEREVACWFSEPWLVGTTKVYSDLVADIVMESLRSKSAVPLKACNGLLTAPLAIIPIQNWHFSEKQSENPHVSSLRHNAGPTAVRFGVGSTNATDTR